MMEQSMNKNMAQKTNLPITKIGVVGAGTMGSAIAQHFIMKGLAVTLVDQTTEYLARGLSTIKQSLTEAKERRIISVSQYDDILARLVTSTNKHDLAPCDLIVEAVFEDLAVKKALFAELEAIVSPQCILASNTSSFLVSDIASELKYQQRVIGVHYFYHAAKNKLVEVIPARNTATAITNTLMDFYCYVDKTPIKVKDAAGFAVNRFFVPWLNEAVRLLEEGYGSIKTIDQISCDVFGVGMGPFALMNATGVPIAKHAAAGLADKLGDFYAPAKMLIAQVASGNEWELNDESLRGNSSENESANEDSNKNNPQIITERMVAATLGVAAQMVSEGVVDASDADLGARTGLRWPMGPFELMNKLGVATVNAMVNKLFSVWQMKVPSFPFTTENADKVALHWVTARVVGTTGFISFELPDRMNPLGEESMQQLNTCVDNLNNNDAIDRIFIVGKGKAFVAGADIKFFLDAIAADDIERIQSFTAYGQQVFNKISASTKTTYAYLDGLALGGGFELALACDYRIATDKTVIAFPETGIGIYPGLGGTQRTTRLIGEGATKYMVATGQFLNAKKAYQLGLVDAVIAPVFDLDELANYRLSQAQAGIDKNVLAEFDFYGFTGELNEPLFNDAKYQASEKMLRRKAPIALKMAMSLISEGAKVSLEQGLALELAGLRDVFVSQDAKTGLTSILTGNKPEFKGE
jgi:enoyl-CoA hydratase / 3-hydroxyacyl-CoA dehydrogenase